VKITQQWIVDIVGDKSFVDIGGLWGTKNERVSDAIRAGASAATMADIAPQDHKLWRAFEAHMADLGVSGYRKISADLMAPDAPRRIGRHDVVHCSGVIYHMPDPVGCLRNLRLIAAEHLVLVSMVVPEIIETPSGSLDLRGAGTLFIPALDDAQRRILHDHFESVGVRVHGINGPVIEEWTRRSDGSPRFGPWWWTLTPGLLREMIAISGFEVVEDAPVVAGRSHGFLCRRV